MPQNLDSKRTMTKADLVEQVHENIGFPKKEAAEIVDCVFDVIKDSLQGGDKIKISGFGNFLVREKAARKGRNPQTNQEIIIEARRVINFKASQILKAALNEHLANVAGDMAS